MSHLSTQKGIYLKAYISVMSTDFTKEQFKVLAFGILLWQPVKTAQFLPISLVKYIKNANDNTV